MGNGLSCLTKWDKPPAGSTPYTYQGALVPSYHCTKVSLLGAGCGALPASRSSPGGLAPFARDRLLTEGDMSPPEDLMG